MKSCMIAPPETVADASCKFPQAPTLGLASIAASACEGGHEVAVIDAFGDAQESNPPFIEGRFIKGLSIEEIVRWVDPMIDVIGLGVMFLKQRPLVRRLIIALRKDFPETPIVVGGEHVTAATATGGFGGSSESPMCCSS